MCPCPCGWCPALMNSSYQNSISSLISWDLASQECPEAPYFLDAKPSLAPTITLPAKLTLLAATLLDDDCAATTTDDCGIVGIITPLLEDDDCAHDDVALLRTWHLSSLFFRWVCQKFFISLSVRPGNLAAIADHLMTHQSHQNLMSHILHIIIIHFKFGYPHPIILYTAAWSSDKSLYIAENMKLCVCSIYIVYTHAHLFPRIWCSLRMISSSSSLNFPLFISGLK